GVVVDRLRDQGLRPSTRRLCPGGRARRKTKCRRRPRSTAKAEPPSHLPLAQVGGFPSLKALHDHRAPSQALERLTMVFTGRLVRKTTEARAILPYLCFAIGRWNRAIR